jgi:formylglycine-generating enzyme required for sulfatase activity
MAKTEVTQAQWNAVMGRNSSHFSGDNLPIENVSWYDAKKFIQKLNAKIGNADGGKMALPTEAQWEYAARAGESGPHSGGSLDEVAWYNINSRSQTHAVGAKKSNAWGLHDMLGNVWEWCEDWYGRDLSGVVDPKGASEGDGRVYKGGGWSNGGGNVWRFAERRSLDPSMIGTSVGFRVCRSLAPRLLHVE